MTCPALTHDPHNPECTCPLVAEPLYPGWCTCFSGIHAPGQPYTHKPNCHAEGIVAAVSLESLGINLPKDPDAQG